MDRELARHVQFLSFSALFYLLRAVLYEIQYRCYTAENLELSSSPDYVFSASEDSDSDLYWEPFLCSCLGISCYDWSGFAVRPVLDTFKNRMCFAIFVLHTTFLP